MTNEQLSQWIKGQFDNVREDILRRRQSSNADVEWERAPIDYDTELTESQLVGERVAPEGVSFRPQRTLSHGSRAPQHEGEEVPDKPGDPHPSS